MLPSTARSLLLGVSAGPRSGVHCCLERAGGIYGGGNELVVASEPPKHPLAHIDPLKCYEWMLAECAAANAQRQAREDGIVATITQISSAALLAVPGVIFASDVSLPAFRVNPPLYLGLGAFVLALASAMAEQYFSGLAYAKHIEVVQSYYLKQSETCEDEKSRSKVRIARQASYWLFASALLMTGVGLLLLE